MRGIFSVSPGFQDLCYQLSSGVERALRARAQEVADDKLLVVVVLVRSSLLGQKSLFFRHDIFKASSRSVDVTEVMRVFALFRHCSMRKLIHFSNFQGCFLLVTLFVLNVSL